MTAASCPRCAAHICADVASVTDTPTGLHIVTHAPVAAHEHACGCGARFHIASTQPAAVHPGQLQLVTTPRLEGAA